MISEQYREQNRLLHDEDREYGSKGGKKHHKFIRKLAERYECKSILDYGCGKGSLKQIMGGIVANYDPATFPELPEPADMVVCTDVLEHIEPEYLDDVMNHLRMLTLKVAFFVVACRKAARSLPDGRNTHLIVQSQQWWLDKIGEKFTIIAEHGPHDEELFLVCE